jgi:hypothetical protein
MVRELLLVLLLVNNANGEQINQQVVFWSLLQTNQESDTEYIDKL